MLSKRGGFLLSPKYSGFIAVAVDGYQKKPPNPTNLNPNSKPCECVGARKADFGEFASASHLGVRTQESRKFYFILFFFLPRMSPAPPPAPLGLPPPPGGTRRAERGRGKGTRVGRGGGNRARFPCNYRARSTIVRFLPATPPNPDRVKNVFSRKNKI